MINWASAWPVLVASGLPSALVGILIGRLNRRIARSDAEKDAKDAARITHVTMLVKMSMASLSLGEATARALQRIPDANCNGDMASALEQARLAKDEYRTFERELAAKSLN